MAKKKTSSKTAAPTKVESIRHKDKRANIPTEELRDFVAEDEKAPKTMLYPRDPSLDPQLVWKGKDEQDQKDLAVPVVPVYIQEKIHPQALVEDLRRTPPSPSKGEGRGEGGGFGDQLSLFADFNGIEEFDKKVDFYQHEQNWTNRMILGDSLLVMTSLAEKEGLKGKVQTIYFDPPYGIKFGSNWQVSTRKRDVKDGKAGDLTRQPEQIRAFRDCWRVGIRKGFVFKRVPHVTLKSIANNPDIKEGMTRQQIDAAIARHAEQETLYDQPYEDNKRIRVTGPFTVESLSPHRVLATEEEQPATIGNGHREHADFATMIIENLRKARVQNTKKDERLKFDRLDPFAGTWIHATGEFTDSDGKAKRVAVSIGPEHGTVGPLQVKEAAKEAVQGVGFDVLIVCGFAFDPHVSEEAKRYGKLIVLPTKMNPDLAMGDELLKKTGAGNLFMVFGEPDLDIKKQKDGKLVAEIKGVDVYDPTTGQIRSDSTDDIACWFIDTEYNGESFFVRHAYFTGAAKDGEGPYDKLKRALRAEIDEAAWSTLYSTTSRPFDPPSTGKIAVKVINHYGDEVLKVFEV